MRTLVCLALLGSTCLAGDLPRSTPEEQGVSSAAILEFVKAVPRLEVHSVMVVRHGHVVAEGWWAPYDSKTGHSLFSLSKSFTSTAVGLAIAEGKLKLSDEVLKFFPEDAPAEPSANLKMMRVSDLLRMSTGQATEPPRTDKQAWTKSFLAHPVPFKPGTHFVYNTSATYMLSAIVQKATGQTVLEYLKPRLFDPLGIVGQTWEASPQGVSTGGYGLTIRTEDIAKFGQLYLQKGKWNGKQLVPEAWVEAATARQTSNGSNPDSDWDQGYGYQFWRSRHGAFRGDGAFGQYCIVLPELDAVIAITSGTRDMPGVLNLVWEKLLPGLKPSPLAPDPEGDKKLASALASLELKPIKSATARPESSKKTFVFPANDRKLESISIESDGKANVMIARYAGVERRIVCGDGSWIKGRAVVGASAEPQAIAASGGWDGDTFIAKVCLVETPFSTTTRLKIAGDEATFSSEMNVGFGGTRQPPLKGKAQ